VGWIALSPQGLRDAQIAAEQALGANPSEDQHAPAVTTARGLLTAEDAARVLAVDASHLLRLAREGRIPRVRIGKYLRFSPADIVGQCTKSARKQG